MPRTAALASAHFATFALLVAWGVCGRVAAAETVWRCAATEGARINYQSMPCRDAGQALRLDKPPTAEDREASSRVAEREARLARAMGRQRVKREKDLPPAHTSLSGPVRQVSVGPQEDARIKARDKSGKSANPSSRHARQRRHDVFRAEVPGHPGKQSGRHQADAVSASPR